MSPPGAPCLPDVAHGALVAVAGRETYVSGRRRAALVAALAEADPAGVELFPLDVAAIEAAGIALRPVVLGFYVAAEPVAIVSYWRAHHLFPPPRQSAA